MTKMISVLAAALFAVSFASSCGKLKECKAATDATTCGDAAKFEGVFCAWKKDSTDAKKGTCETDTCNGKDATACPNTDDVNGKKCVFDATAKTCKPAA